MRIGYDHGSGKLAGSLDNTRIYNRALSVAEVGQLYQSESGDLDSDGDGLADAWERGYGRYQIVSGNFTWEQAKADAEARGGRLATITSQAEYQDMFRSIGGSSQLPNWGYHLGDTDKAQVGVWRWVTGEEWVFNDWGPGEPNNTGIENYLMIFGTGSDQGESLKLRWNNTLPTTALSYILEKDYPTDSTLADTDGDGFNDSIEIHFA